MADIILRGNSMDGAVRVFVAVTTDLVSETQKIHHTYPVATVALGRALTAASIIGVDLKNETDTTTIQFKGDGPLGSIVAVTESNAHVRGYVVNPNVDLPPNKKGMPDVGKAVGQGYLNVIRDLGLKEPYVGQVPIVTGEIAEDLTYYFATSEQIPTAMSLGVMLDDDKSVKAAGGFMIQLMPEATEEIAIQLEEKMKTIEPVTKMIEKGMSAEDIFFAVTEGFDMIMENNGAEPRYECKCSRERMEKALISIGKKELEDIIAEQGEAELVCQFCDNKYKFFKTELEKLLEEAK